MWTQCSHFLLVKLQGHLSQNPRSTVHSSSTASHRSSKRQNKQKKGGRSTLHTFQPQPLPCDLISRDSPAAISSPTCLFCPPASSAPYLYIGFTSLSSSRSHEMSKGCAEGTVKWVGWNLCLAWVPKIKTDSCSGLTQFPGAYPPWVCFCRGAVPPWPLIRKSMCKNRVTQRARTRPPRSQSRSSPACGSLALFFTTEPFYPGQKKLPLKHLLILKFCLTLAYHCFDSIYCYFTFCPCRFLEALA